MCNYVLVYVFLICLYGVYGEMFQKYHTNEEMEEFLKDFNESTTELTARLYSIGRSGKNHSLNVIELTAASQDTVGVPNVKLIGNIHGNEAAGREILLNFLLYLRENYRSDRHISWLLNNTRIHILPSMNPDGFEYKQPADKCTGINGRSNHANIDLNRSFPDYYHENPIPQAKETVAVMNWMNDVSFILSAALHGGAVVANYPFDTVEKRVSGETNKPSLTSDDDVFKHLAKTYANNHLTMHQNIICEDGSYGNGIENGTINGATWYVLVGGMQDYNYAFKGCMELTLEISCCKFPQPSELKGLWEENKQALLEYCSQANMGVTGRILDMYTNKPIQNAVLKINNRDMNFKSNTNGEFWRILLPGHYKLEVDAIGYYPMVVPFEVLEFEKPFPKLTNLSISLINASYSTTTERKTTFTTTSTTSLPTTQFKKLTTEEPNFNGLETDNEIHLKAQASTLIENSSTTCFLNLNLLLLLLFTTLSSF